MSSSSIFVDYSRAFDTIDHDILCEKLHLYGLDTASLSWFRFVFHFRATSNIQLDLPADVFVTL